VKGRGARRGHGWVGGGGGCRGAGSGEGTGQGRGAAGKECRGDAVRWVTAEMECYRAVMVCVCVCVRVCVCVCVCVGGWVNAHRRVAWYADVYVRMCVCAHTAVTRSWWLMSRYITRMCTVASTCVHAYAQRRVRCAATRACSPHTYPTRGAHAGARVCRDAPSDAAREVARKRAVGAWRKQPLAPAPSALPHAHACVRAQARPSRV